MSAQNDKLVEALEPVEAMRQACIAAVRAEQMYEGSDFPVCNAIVHAIKQIPATLSRSDDGAGEAVAWMYERAMGLGVEPLRIIQASRWTAYDRSIYTEAPLYAHPPAAVAGEGEKLAELIRTRLLGIHPDEQDLQLEDDDWRLILQALSRAAADAAHPPADALREAEWKKHYDAMETAAGNLKAAIRPQLDAMPFADHVEVRRAFNDIAAISGKALDYLQGRAALSEAPSAGEGKADATSILQEVVGLAMRDINREQTDFIGRMHQAMGDFEYACDQHASGEMDEAGREEAADALASLAGLALAQLAIVTTPNDPLSALQQAGER
ncbi:hypothetical protein [Sphingobium lactosutens]|uniref:hypothetical protein n=1 Tax=Sphingobium lactosutens TaxID=522773 RepID=UPI001D1975E8|nr:hypothetical protein [Sphingobium lactosutens]MCC4257857.1 hypothetical protein [Sphingobium lactosutens]MEE2741096.1 hypothetical protein [Pseudomonadota bacterium]